MRFFQGYSPKEADTHGIVYTPQPIVNFMVRSVEEILQKEFGRSLSDKGVHILDPFVGTGNFITRIMQEISAIDLPYKYENELHCNEVMLLPYYIASMNIEHAYYERVGEYKAFPGICLVDTFELAETEQASLGFMTEENAERVKRQKHSPIFVIIGNPPYNAWQVDENDNNKNRKYAAMDKRVAETYARDSKAQNKNALRDPYIKASRWASDRIGQEGIVALVTNSGFVDSIGADGMRMHLARQFDAIYIMDLGGNVLRNPKLSGTTHNVFGIQRGVSINLFVRHNANKDLTRFIRYARVDEYWRKEQKYEYLDQNATASDITWQTLIPDAKNNWLTAGLLEDFERFPSISSICAQDTNGLKTNRDEWAYNFDCLSLTANIKRTIEVYNREVARWASRKEKKIRLDDFLITDDRQISWSETLKKHVQAGDYITFDKVGIRQALYRPFCSQYVYFDALLNERQYQLRSMFPVNAGGENRIIWCKVGSDLPFFALSVNKIPDALPQSGSRCFPFYTYAEDGTNRRENITDWALDQFRSHYADPSITKWDIFHYVYAILHHPEYRERYAANLRRELPRIPFAGAEAHEDGPRDAGLEPAEIKPGSSPKAQTDAGSTVEERPFEGRVTKRKKENNSTLPKAVAVEQSSQATSGSDDRRYKKLSDEAKEQVLRDLKAEMDSGNLHYASQDNARVFHAFAKAGQRLAEIHVHYEQQPEYKLTRTEKKGEKLDYRVIKMKLSKDKTTLIYNQFLTLSGIPPETYDYRLGNRSALEWIIDQYQVSTDKRSGITNDPNREDDREYILRLIGQVITVSLETVKIVATLPELKISAMSTD